MTFEQMGLATPVLKSLARKDYTKPTPIQEQAIPIALQGRDLLGIAQTGTGKTAAFMLPSIHRMADDRRPSPPKGARMLVLAPTRELAGQIAKSARDYGATSGMTVAVVVGGTSVNKDRHNLARGVDILVATPGRLVDLMEQRAVSLRDVEILVLDEADYMLDLGFVHSLRKIVAQLPDKRQTMLFSATMPSEIKKLSGQYLCDPAQVSVAPAATTAEKVDQYVCHVSQREKQALLNLSLAKGLASGEIEQALVFTRTKHGADRVVRRLKQAGVDAEPIHGNRSQPQREKALGAFRSGKTRVLVATDVAARGIDVPEVSHVFNFELPNVAEQYVHRIGRTARAGRAGVSVSFCNHDDERGYLRDIERLTRVQLVPVPLPENFRDAVDGMPADVPPARQPRDGRGHSHGQRRPKKVGHIKPRGNKRGGEKPVQGQPKGGRGRRKGKRFAGKAR